MSTDDFPSEWLRFVLLPTTGKTKQWRVVSKRGIYLGTIRWWGAWRQYVFQIDEPDRIFNRGCLADVTEFLRLAMDERKKK